MIVEMTTYSDEQCGNDAGDDPDGDQEDTMMMAVMLIIMRF